MVLRNSSEKCDLFIFDEGKLKLSDDMGFGFSGAFSCGLFSDIMDNQELPVSVMAVFGRSDDLVGKNTLLHWSQI